MECADFQWMTRREVLSLSLSPRKLDVIYSQNTPVPSLPLCWLGAGISPNGNLRAAFSSLSSDLWPRMAEAADPTELREEDSSVRHSSRSQVARTTRAFHAKCSPQRSSSIPLSHCHHCHFGGAVAAAAESHLLNYSLRWTSFTLPLLPRSSSSWTRAAAVQ